MGLIFGIPITRFFKELFSAPVNLLKCIITYWWLKILYRNRRLDVYDPDNRKELTNIGYVISEPEKTLEAPDNNLDLHATDSVLIFGGNSSGEYLVARVCREREGHVAWLLLELSDGYCYQLPYSDKSYPPSADFMAGGLRVKCNVPARYWRISYNGLLRRVRGNDDDSKYVHVKFSFNCISTSFIFDAFEDIHPKVMMSYLTSEPPLPWIPKVKKITRYLNRYVQSVCVIGTVSIDGGEECELNLYGVKHRSRDTQTCQRSPILKLNEYLCYTKDGQMIYSGSIKPPGFKSSFQYGHFMERCGLSWPVEKCRFSNDENIFSGDKLELKTERNIVSVEVNSPSTTVRFPSGLLKGHVTRANLSTIRTHDGDTGHALILEHSWTPTESEKLEGPLWCLPSTVVSESESERLILPLSNSACQHSALSGGKGSSLASLTYLSVNYQTNFQVPSGFVVTTSAYKEFYLKSGIMNVISQFEKKILSCEAELRSEICNNLVNQVAKTKLPRSIEDAIRRQMREQFSDHEKKKMFAVRSSASGEDSEEMSAAGQMSTLLGVQGTDKILQAVVKCWASQFSFTAIEYKRQNGQELNSMMAVVIQEMVPADIAGVLFTCDPVTGNPQNVTITANYGIGESVVAATAEPDTVVLERDHTNRVSVKSVQIGMKKTKIVVADGGNVVEKTNTAGHSNVCSISPHNSKILGEISLKIEEAYGFPIDVEWAFQGSQLFMLQARPVTTFDKETKYELAHAADNGYRAEDEFNTKANIGEVLSDAISYLGASHFRQINDFMYHVSYGYRDPYCFPFNPFQKAISFSQNHALMSMPNMILRFYVKGQQSFIAESIIISGFGRLIDDENVFDQADKRNKTYPSPSAPFQLLCIIKDLLLAGYRLNRETEAFSKEEMDLKHCRNSKEMYLEILQRCADTLQAPSLHLENTVISSIYNGIIMSILRSANKGWGVAVYSDFSSILSSCGNVESADIPLSVEQLLKDISESTDVQKFKEMEPKDALDWLEMTQSSAGTSFRDFLRKHGHRCLKEFDVYSKPWRVNKLPLIKVFQDSVNQAKASDKKDITTSEVIDQLKVPLTWMQKLILKLLIPLCRRAVAKREKSKSLFIKHFDFARKGYYMLAEQMEKEGRLPEQDLLFFLTEFELLQLIETRSSTLVQKASRRRQIFPEMVRLRFPQVTRGIPKPINVKKREDFDNIQSDLEIKGVPVSQGITKGLARVAANLKEAADIQKGDILIAYCTDIAWSPYFPLLSGVATELGGLISHGAVVAREYGLPCVVGVFDATVKFKTGDLVLLDGNKGILKRLEPASS